MTQKTDKGSNAMDWWNKLGNGDRIEFHKQYFPNKNSLYSWDIELIFIIKFAYPALKAENQQLMDSNRELIEALELLSGLDFPHYVVDALQDTFEDKEAWKMEEAKRTLNKVKALNL